MAAADGVVSVTHARATQHVIQVVSHELVAKAIVAIDQQGGFLSSVEFKPGEPGWFDVRYWRAGAIDL